jgi:hypothetical protein
MLDWFSGINETAMFQGLVTELNTPTLISIEFLSKNLFFKYCKSAVSPIESPAPG